MARHGQIVGCIKLSFKGFSETGLLISGKSLSSLIHLPNALQAEGREDLVSRPLLVDIGLVVIKALLIVFYQRAKVLRPDKALGVSLLAEPAVGDIDESHDGVAIGLFGGVGPDMVHVQMVGTLKMRADHRVIDIVMGLTAAGEDEQIGIVARGSEMIPVQMLQGGLHDLHGTGKVEIADIQACQITRRPGVCIETGSIRQVRRSIQRFLPVELRRTSLPQTVIGKALPEVTFALAHGASLLQTVGQRQHAVEVFLLINLSDHLERFRRCNTFTPAVTTRQQRYQKHQKYRCDYVVSLPHQANHKYVYCCGKTVKRNNNITPQ